MQADNKFDVCHFEFEITHYTLHSNVVHTCSFCCRWLSELLLVELISISTGKGLCCFCYSRIHFVLGYLSLLLRAEDLNAAVMSWIDAITTLGPFDYLCLGVVLQPAGH